jgi:phosphorylcholine phosphatase
MYGMKHDPVKLHSPGWNGQTRRGLEKLIQRGAGRGLPVVFDFDNTIICGDIGEATLAMLVRHGLIKAKRISETLSPPFRLPDGRRITLKSGPDLTSYYEAYLAPTAHGQSDPTPLANGYAWAVEVMEGLSPADVIEATLMSREFAQPRGPGFIEVTPGKTSFPAPTFYPEMVELVAAFLCRGFDVWIVSASNVWTVRWMVQHELNPRLREHGAKGGLRADHVVGVSTLLTDRRGGLHKDALLVKENAPYAALEEKTLRRFRLTSRLQFPVPTYSGKIACICDVIGERPYFGVGDSPGDHAMLAFCKNRLWIARLEKPGFQKITARLMARAGPGGWLVQPTLAKKCPGFVADLKSLPHRLGDVPQDIRSAARVASSLNARCH